MKELINGGVDRNCDVVITVTLFEWFSALFAHLAKSVRPVCCIYWPIHFK